MTSAAQRIWWRYRLTQLIPQAANRTFWVNKVDNSGPQIGLPPLVSHLFNLFRLCRANLMILSDSGAIHPGPTIYDSFWFRDSSVEGIACALTGDTGIPGVQFGTVYLDNFNLGPGTIGSSAAALHGFFGADHEKNDQEWDSNGEALSALGRFDRIRGTAATFGAGVYSPFVVEGARWIRDNRSVPYGLLLSGWSAEHLGERTSRTTGTTSGVLPVSTRLPGSPIGWALVKAASCGPRTTTSERPPPIPSAGFLTSSGPWVSGRRISRPGLLMPGA